MIHTLSMDPISDKRRRSVRIQASTKVKRQKREEKESECNIPAISSISTTTPRRTRTTTGVKNRSIKEREARGPKLSEDSAVIGAKRHAESTSRTRRRPDYTELPSIIARKLRSNSMSPDSGRSSECQLLKNINALKEAEPLEKNDIFPFMDLPSELRLAIYQMALKRDTPLILHRPRPTTAEIMLNSRNVGRYISPTTDQLTRLQLEEEFNSMDYQGPQENIIPEWLGISRTIYKEAQNVLYEENTFIIRLDTGYSTLMSFRQCTRSLIKHAIVTVPSHHDVLDRFSNLVRTALRYCTHLKTLHVTLPRSFPVDQFSLASTNIYANAFHILRWLPQGCKVEVEGGVNETIMGVIENESRLLETLNEVDYRKRQHQLPEGTGINPQCKGRS